MATAPRAEMLRVNIVSILLGLHKGRDAGTFPGDEAGQGPCAADLRIDAPPRPRPRASTRRRNRSANGPIRRRKGRVRRRTSGKTAAAQALGRAKEIRAMRSNSGGGKSKNNRGNPTLEEHERARGRSGAAIAGEKKSAGEPDRQS